MAFRQRGGRKAVPASLERAYGAFPVLGERRRQRGGTLSGGQQRLLSLAKVLVVPPKLLIADELSLGLAPVVIEAVYEGLRSIHQAGTALLVVEQQIDRVLEHGHGGHRARARERRVRRTRGRGRSGGRAGARRAGQSAAILTQTSVSGPKPAPADEPQHERRPRRWSRRRTQTDTNGEDPT